MCRFALYLGEEITVSALTTEPEHSIIHQSVHSLEGDEPLNGDGFGIGWYVPDLTDRPAIFKCVTPAWNDLNLMNLAPVTRSRCILAHVRAATPGLAVTQLNCHPFSWGPFSFMHNGRIEGFSRVKRHIQTRLSDEAYGNIAGSTDSEHIFGLFSDHYCRLSSNGASDRVEAMYSALLAAIADVEDLRGKLEIEKPAKLNMALADGKCAVVTRYISDGSDEANSLYVRAGRRFVSKHGECWFEETEVKGRHGAVLVASEPLTVNEGWVPVTPNHALVIREDLSLQMREMEIPEAFAR